MRPSAEVQFMKLLRDCQRNPGNRVSFTGVVEVYTREGQFIGTIETTADDIARKERNNKHHPEEEEEERDQTWEEADAEFDEVIRQHMIETPEEYDPEGIAIMFSRKEIVKYFGKDYLKKIDDLEKNSH